MVLQVSESVNAERFSPLGYVSCCGESAVFHCCCLGKPAAALQYFFAGKATETEYSLTLFHFVSLRRHFLFLTKEMVTNPGIGVFTDVT